MVIVFVTSKAHTKYLNLVGYMFEQSIPLRGMALNSPFLHMSTKELVDYSVWSASQGPALRATTRGVGWND